MQIGVVGINHHLAPIQIREQVAFTDIKKIEAMTLLLDDIQEVVILSTCNRSEIYIKDEKLDEKLTILTMFYHDFFELEDINPYLFVYRGVEAIEHLFNVTAGLDSIVIGEDQILGQVKKAHELAMQMGASKKILNKLFREAITCAKEIKATTKISEQPLSLSYIAVKLLREKLQTFQGKKALIIGCGKMGQLAMTYLAEEGIEALYVANRHLDKVQKLQQQIPIIIPIDYDTRYEVLTKVDMVICATAAPHVILSVTDAKAILKPLVMIDLALPRDIDPSFKSMTGVNLYDMDDFKRIHHINEMKRDELANESAKKIKTKVTEFTYWLEREQIDPLIQALNTRCSQIKDDSLSYLLKKLDLELKEEKLIEQVLESSLKRLIREPLIKVKQIEDSMKRDTYVKVIEELFDI